MTNCPKCNSQKLIYLSGGAGLDVHWQCRRCGLVFTKNYGGVMDNPTCKACGSNKTVYVGPGMHIHVYRCVECSHYMLEDKFNYMENKQEDAKHETPNAKERNFDDRRATAIHEWMRDKKMGK